MLSPRFPRALRLLILLSFSAGTALATAACSHTAVRVSQIPIRPDLRQCAALMATQPEDRPAIASDPDLSAFAPVIDASVLAAIQRAAGDHARRTQFQERAAGDIRDVQQAVVNRENCEKLGEVVSLVDANNAGPEDD